MHTTFRRKEQTSMEKRARTRFTKGSNIGLISAGLLTKAYLITFSAFYESISKNRIITRQHELKLSWKLGRQYLYLNMGSTSDLFKTGELNQN